MIQGSLDAAPQSHRVPEPKLRGGRTDQTAQDLVQDFQHITLLSAAFTLRNLRAHLDAV